MKENKTKPTEISVEEFIQNSDPKKTEDCRKLVKIMEKLSGEHAKMWGTAIVGFGTYHYKYESGREGDMCKIGFSPRKNEFSLYLSLGFLESEKLLEQLGKYKKSKGSCVYIKKLEDISLPILEELISKSLENIAKIQG